MAPFVCRKFRFLSMDLFTVFLLALCLFNLFNTGYGSYAFALFIFCLVCIDLIVQRIRSPSLLSKIVASLLLRNRTEDKDRTFNTILEDIISLEDKATTGRLCLLRNRTEDKDRTFNTIFGVKLMSEQRVLVPAASTLKPQSLSIDKNAFVGMEEGMIKVKDMLFGSASLETIAIVGMGGIGKTTLAAAVYSDSLVCHHFDVLAWVVVSQEYSLRRVILDLLNSAGLHAKSIHKESDEWMLRELLYKSLRGRRYFIVIDDVLDSEILHQIIRFLPNDGNGSRILLTTRLTAEANYITSSRHIHRMRLLNEDESWSVLHLRVFGKNECPHELRQIGFEIAQRCNGLPLALAVIGSLLSSTDKTEGNWKNVYNGLSASVNDVTDDMLMDILALSYNHLPLHLKPCFLYMGMFPGDYEVPATKLAHLWAAEGFLQRSKDFDSPEKISEEYLEDLVGKHLILVSHRNSQGKIKRWKIHDVVRDLCLRVARKEKFFALINSLDDIPREGTESYVRLAVHPDILRIYSNILHGKRTHSILCVGDDFVGLGHNIKFNFLHYKLLRVLDLLIIHLSIFPLEVCNLVSLRYLALSFTGTLHQHISRLWNLQTIVHRDPSSRTGSKLPVEIWTMPNLRHLYVPATCLTSPPRGMKASFNLHTLVGVINLSFGIQIIDKIKSVRKLAVSYDVELESFKGWSGHRLQNLVCLNQLEKLKFWVTNSSVPSSASWPWNLALPQSLKKLTLSGCCIPWGRMKIVGVLPYLEVLKLRDNACRGEKWEPIQGQYFKLKQLELQHLDLVSWIADDINFPSLECLSVRSCHRLVEIPLGIGEIWTLKKVELSNCHPRAVASAEKILAEQQEFGNFQLKVTILGDDRLKTLTEMETEKSERGETPKDQSEIEEAGEQGIEFDHHDDLLLKSKMITPYQTPAFNQSTKEMEKQYAPFVRNDVYGAMGRGKLPWAEKFLLLVAFVFLVSVRLVLSITMLLVYYMICRVCTAFVSPSKADEQKNSAHISGRGRLMNVPSDWNFLFVAVLTVAFVLAETRVILVVYATTLCVLAFVVSGRSLQVMTFAFLIMAFVFLEPERMVRVVFGVSAILSLLFVFLCMTNEQEDYPHISGWQKIVIVQGGRFFSRAILFLWGFYWISETNRVNETASEGKSEEPGAFISNHVSYLDILYHMSNSFPSFVATRSIAKLPLIGFISKCLGCVYKRLPSEQHNFRRVPEVVDKRIGEAHRNKLAQKMLLFPEGTTTNGDYLLPFKVGAFSTGAPVLPIILKYPYRRFSPAWDSISGLRHFILLLSQFVNHIEVTRLPVYYPSEQEKEDPKLYAENVRMLMAAEGNLVVSNLGLAEKRIYHAALNGSMFPTELETEKSESSTTSKQQS